MKRTFTTLLVVALTNILVVQPVLPTVAYATESNEDSAVILNSPSETEQTEAANSTGNETTDETELEPADATESQNENGSVEQSAQAPTPANPSEDEKPVPGADGPTSPTNASTHIDMSASDLLSEDQIAEANAKLRSRSRTYSGRVSFADLLVYAEQYLGMPYVWGAKNPSQGGFDCSGFTNWVFNHVAGTNINSNYTSAAGIYSQFCTPISESQARPGDLVFFKYTYGSSRSQITHVGIYCGNGIMINAGDPIGYDPVTSVHNVRGQVAERVYGRMRGVSVDSTTAVNLGKLGKLSVGDAWYTGKAVTPTVNLVAGGQVLKQDTDYTVSYSNNINVGVARVTVQGKGRYTGSISTTFDVVDTSLVLKDGVYTISSALGNRVLDIPGGKTSAGEVVQLYDSNGSTAQQYQIKRLPDGYYSITNVKSGLSLSSAPLIGLMNGVTISQEKADGTRRQEYMIKQSGGKYVIASAWDSTYVFDVAGGANKNGAKVQVYKWNGSNAQHWNLHLKSASSQNNQSKPNNQGSTSARQRLDDLAAKNKGALPDGTYRLSTLNSSSAVLDVPGASKANGTALQLYASNGSDAQAWVVKNDSQGYVTIRNAASGKVLDITGASKRSGARAQQYASNDSRAQKWVAVKDGKGYKLVSALSESLVLDVAGGSTRNGAAVQTYASNNSKAQRWAFAKTQTSAERAAAARQRLDKLAADNKGALPDGTYRVSTLNSSSAVLDVPGASRANGTALQLYASNGSDAQAWRVSHDSKGYVTIKNAASGKVLDVPGASTRNGARTQQYASNGSRAQKWVAVKDGGAYKLVSALSESIVLDVAGGSTRNGAAVQTYASNNSKAQRWAFNKVTNVKPVAYPFSLASIVATNGGGSRVSEYLNPSKWSYGEGGFYQFADLRTGTTSMNGSQINTAISNTFNGKRGVFAGKGNSFVSAAQSAGINPVYLFAHAMIETAWGTSNMAKGKHFDSGTVSIKIDGKTVSKHVAAGTYYNFFGWGAYDSNPDAAFDYARYFGWNSIDAALKGAASKIASSYIYAGQETLYEMRWNPDYTATHLGKRSHQYATDPAWADSIARTMGSAYRLNGITAPNLTYYVPQYQ